MACNIKQDQEQNSLNTLDKYINLKMERDKVPGLSACIIKDDKIIWSKGYGWADVEQKIPMTENSIIGVASISKLITATAIMQLSEQNKIILSDPVNKYIPFKIQHPVYPDVEITIAHILSHTSSISNGPSLWRSYKCGYETINLDEWARAYFLTGGDFYHKEGNFTEWKPGESFLYSNSGYALLSYLVEVVSGMPFNQYCKKNVFEPLNMQNTSFLIADLDERKLATKYSYGYNMDLERDLIQQNVDYKKIIMGHYFFPLCNYTSPTYAAGGLYSNVAELSKFLFMLMNAGVYKDKVLLSDKSVKKFLSPYVNSSLLPGKFAAFGLGGYAMKLNNGESVWGHTGADPGTSTFMLFNPEIKMGAIVLANRFVDIRDLIEWLFAEGFGEYWNKPIDHIDKNWKQYSNIEKQRKIGFRVRSNYLPGGSQIYIIGNHRYLGCWGNAGIPMLPQKDGSWEKTIFFTDSTKIEFKITRGSFDKEAVTFSDGKALPNFKHLVEKDTVFNITVEDWKDLWE